MSASNNNNTGDDDDNQETILASIESALSGIETQLTAARPSLLRASGSRNIHGTNDGRITAATATGGAGRAVRESIRMALGSLRARLSTVEQTTTAEAQPTMDQTTTSTTATTTSTLNNRPARRDSSAVVRELSERLATAELAHSNRIPLNVLLEHRQERSAAASVQQEGQQQQQQSGAVTAPTATGTPTRKQQEHGQQQQPPPQEGGSTTTPATTNAHARRRAATRSPSVLMASRRMADEAQGPAADMDLHGTSIMMQAALLEVQQEEEQDDDEQSMGQHEAAMQVDDAIVPEEKEDEEMMASLDDEQSYPDDANTKQHLHVPILLTQTSYTRLDPARRSILFYPSERRLSTVAAPAPRQQSSTVVYSWGIPTTSSSSMEDENDKHSNTLHDDGQVRTLANDQARVKSDSRVGMRDIANASVGRHHSACCTSTGEVLTCGLNKDGAVDPDQAKKYNNNDNPWIVRPILLESLAMSRIVQVSCGANHTAALRSNGAVLTWGGNEFGQLGHRVMPFRRGSTAKTDLSTFCSPKIMVLGPGRRATSVACGDGFTLVLTSRMGLLACGIDIMCGGPRNGDNDDDDDDGHQKRLHLASPLPALEDLPLVSMAAGRRHAVALTAHGSAFAWGENTSGCLGREFPKATTVPVPIRVVTKLSPSRALLPEPLSNWAFWNNDTASGVSLANDIAVVDAACGDEHTVLVTRSGQLLVCGSNSRGQLGLDPASNPVAFKAEPVKHLNGKSFVSAQAGEAHTLLLDDAGDVWQFGAAATTATDTAAVSKPEVVLEGKDIRWIAAGGSQNIAVAAATGRTLPNPEFSDDGGEEVSFLTRGRSVEDLLSALPEGKRTKDQEEKLTAGETEAELASRAEELLKTPAVLNSLFLDPTELEDLFEQLLSAESPQLRQNIAYAVEKGIRRGLETVRSDDARLLYPEQVRFLLLYIQCPLFVGWEDSQIVFDQRGDLILLLCDTILGLSYEGYKAFLSWATSIYPRELFTRLLVRPLIAQLAKGLSVEAGALRRPLPAVVAVLRWLYNASERADNIAAPEAFYCEAIGETDPRWLVEDLLMLKKADLKARAANFFMCDNPFLFSPSIKRTLLMYESEMNMLRTAAQRLTYNEEEKTYEFDPFYVLDIDREHLLTQTFQKIEKAEPNDLRKKLRVVFKGEDGVDAGGVTREFFQLLCAELFDVNSGMWSVSLDADQITWFNSDCNWNDHGFFLVGVLLGLAVYNSVLLDVHFPQAVYRKLLGHSLGFEDLVDLEIKSGLQQLLDYQGDDVEDIFCLTFDVNWMDLGEEKRRELKPGGSNIAVTSDNKEEYVMLYVKWLLVDSINPQYDAFEKGFLRVMEDSSLDLLRPEDLELLVVGSPELDFEALEKNAEYEGGYDSSSDVIRHFWHFTKNATRETQLNLLRFTTGSAKAPIGGLGELSFKIQRAGPDSMQLPSSHTCFNTLLLPDYGDNYDKLEERLSRAILECEGFGLQ